MKIRALIGPMSSAAVREGIVRLLAAAPRGYCSALTADRCGAWSAVLERLAAEPYDVLIAEFGAGSPTIDSLFELRPELSLIEVDLASGTTNVHVLEVGSETQVRLAEWLSRKAGLTGADDTIARVAHARPQPSVAANEPRGEAASMPVPQPEPESQRDPVSAPDSPDTRNTSAPPPSEAPEPGPAPEPACAAEGDGDAASTAPGEPGTAAEIMGMARPVADYSAEVPALAAIENGLEQYRVAEIAFVGNFLAGTTMLGIHDVSASLQREIDELAAGIAARAGVAADRAARLADARERAATAKAKATALLQPAASIRARLKAADSIRAEAMKASATGNYALAYWLVMDGGRLDEMLRAEPRIIAAPELESAVRRAAADQAEAEREAAALEGEVQAFEAAAQADRARLAALEASLPTRIRDSLSRFNPRSTDEV